MRKTNHRLMLAAVATATALAWGCNKPAAETTEASPTGEGQAQASAGAGSGSTVVAPPATTPDQAVVAFLNAVRAGKSDVAASLLTNRARAEMDNAGLPVQPPGSPSAKFEIGEIQLLPDHAGAHVASTWSDTTPEGELRSYDITWILRNENDAWRVAGMATRLFEDLAPVILNFEDPNDMRAQVEAAEAEIARRVQSTIDEATIRQATLPQEPPAPNGIR
ncbi:MAG: hypothetical protein KDA41_22750 [Planctomycetales bacterium]|nr:hypothetical protein [Planctomycetales bacterium]